jgi:hypothetical protein
LAVLIKELFKKSHGSQVRPVIAMYLPAEPRHGGGVPDRMG